MSSLASFGVLIRARRITTPVRLMRLGHPHLGRPPPWPTGSCGVQPIKFAQPREQRDLRYCRVAPQFCVPAVGGRV